MGGWYKGNPNMIKLCECGCGLPAPATPSRYVKGQAARFISGHNGRKHGQLIGGKRPPEYAAYADAKSRCFNCADESYPDYGGRGIKFLFTNFIQFFEELGLRPSANHSLDRIDTNGHYAPGNVRWATEEEQHANQRIRKDSPKYDSLCPWRTK